MSERLYTRDEANAILPHVRALVERAQALHRRIADTGRGRRLAQAAAGNGGGEAAHEVMVPEAELRVIVTEIDRMGIVFRDAGSGLLDFPAERDGEPVFLCWRLGEEGVDHWHPRDTGFAGRQPL